MSTEERTRVYITQSYDSPYATLNPIWAAAREHDYVPDVVHLLSPRPESGEVASLVSGLEALQEALGVEPSVEVVGDDPEDFEDTAETVWGLVRESVEAGHRIAVDITPGRTIPKVALFEACLKLPEEERPDHLFYLSVSEFDYRAEPFVKIPFRRQRLMDLSKEVWKRDA